LGYVVVDRDGHPLLASMPAPAIDFRRIPRKADATYLSRRSRHTVYAVLSVPILLRGRPLWVVATQNLNHPASIVDDIVRQFLLYGVLVVLPLLLILLAIDALIVRHALRPVRRASALVRTIAPTRLDVRLTDPDIPLEVRPLAEAVNVALDRLTDSLQMQRDFTADAAHELRTPITVARVRAGEIADPDLRGALIGDLDALTRTVGHLLDITEMDSFDSLSLDHVDLSELAREGVAAVAPLVFREGKSIALHNADQPFVVLAQPQFVTRALGALLENAIKHTPAGTRINVAVGPDSFSVIDDGPGIPLVEQEHVFRRFWRHDRTTTANAGLGLAIVQRVAEVHDGRITLESQPGRTRFTFTFPESRAK
jgi:signal transduction histidine kinase